MLNMNTVTQEQPTVTLNYMTMYDFKAIKTELQRRNRKTRHFTKAFLTAYAKARQDIQTNTAAGIDTSYYDGIIYTRHEYDAIRQTAFYRVESGAYCEFLEIAYAVEQKAREKAEREQGQEVKAA